MSMPRSIADRSLDFIMPMGAVDFDKHGRIARIKPRSSAKDQDNRSVVSSTSNRKHRDSSSSSSRTALPPDHSLQSSDSATQSTNQDQLPLLTESDSGSPSSTSSQMFRTNSNVSASTALTSPIVRTNSIASTSAALTSPKMYRTPASLQPYLESEDDTSITISESQATPRPERRRNSADIKKGNGKASQQGLSPEVSKPRAKMSSETTRPSSTQLPSRTVPPQPLRQGQQPEESHHAQPQKESHQSQHSEQSTPSLDLETAQLALPAPVPAPAFGSRLLNQEAFYSPQYPYPLFPQATGPPTSPPNMPPQPLLYYPDYHEYGPPPPTQPSAHQLQYTAVPKHGINDDSRLALLERVHSVIPDLHSLLNTYQEVHGLLKDKEIHIGNVEAHLIQLQQVHVRCAQLEAQLQSAHEAHRTDIGNMKTEVTALEKRCKELKGRLMAEEKRNDELKAAMESLRLEQKRAEKKQQEEKTAIAREFAIEKEQVLTDQRTNQRAMHDQLQAQSRKSAATLSYELANLSRRHEEEKQSLENKWAKQKREFEDRHARSLRELEDTLEAKRKVVDEERRTYLQAREGWEKERETMARRWEEERLMLQRGSEEQRKALTIKYQREKDDILKQSSQMQNKTDQDESMLKLQKENEILRANWDADKFRFQRASAEFKATARTLNEQNSKLQKLTESFGETTEWKSNKS